MTVVCYSSLKTEKKQPPKTAVKKEVKKKG